jgi:hypothetical protein
LGGFTAGVDAVWVDVVAVGARVKVCRVEVGGSLASGDGEGDGEGEGEGDMSSPEKENVNDISGFERLVRYMSAR